MWCACVCVSVRGIEGEGERSKEGWEKTKKKRMEIKTERTSGRLCFFSVVMLAPRALGLT